MLCFSSCGIVFELNVLNFSQLTYYVPPNPASGQPFPKGLLANRCRNRKSAARSLAQSGVDEAAQPSAQEQGKKRKTSRRTGTRPLPPICYEERKSQNVYFTYMQTNLLCKGGWGTK